MSYFIHKTDKPYAEFQKKAFLSEADFCDRVKFKFGIPLIVLDFIDYMTGYGFINLVQTFVNAPKYIERFDPTNDDF